MNGLWCVWVVLFVSVFVFDFFWVEGCFFWKNLMIVGEMKLVCYFIYLLLFYDVNGEFLLLFVGFYGIVGYFEQILQILGLFQCVECYGFVVVCLVSSGWYGCEFWLKKLWLLSVCSDEYVVNVFECILVEFYIDEDCVYLFGVLKGGVGVWYWVFKEFE